MVALLPGQLVALPACSDICRYNQADMHENSFVTESDGTDRLCDELILFIFALLPIKSIASTAAVCKRWNRLFHKIQLCPTVLDFGYEFSQKISRNELVGSVSLSLRLLRDNKLKGFKLAFCPSLSLMFDLYDWLQCLAEKEIVHLELDFHPRDGDDGVCQMYNGYAPFKLPSCLSKLCQSITHFKLNFSTCSDFSGFTFLSELHLFDVGITGEKLQRMLVACPSLEALYLGRCLELRDAKIRTSGANLQLKFLSIMEMPGLILELDAPKLRTLYFNSFMSLLYVTNVTSVVDAIICAFPRFDDHFASDLYLVQLLNQFRHVEILTMCDMIFTVMDGLMENEFELIPISFNNLYELHLLLDDILHKNDLTVAFYSLFALCKFPSIEKLFIEFDIYGSTDFCYYSSPPRAPEVDNPYQVIPNIKFVEIKNFHGHDNEIALVKFLLKGAVDLEFMVLVTAWAIDPSHSSSVFEQVLLFPKASPEAQIRLYGYGQDVGFSPTHTIDQYAPHCMLKRMY